MIKTIHKKFILFIIFLLSIAVSFCQNISLQTTYTIYPQVIYEKDNFTITITLTSLSSFEDVKIALVSLDKGLQSSSLCDYCELYSPSGECKSYSDSCYINLGDMGYGVSRSYSFKIRALKEGIFIAKVGIRYTYLTQEKEFFISIPIKVISKDKPSIDISYSIQGNVTRKNYFLLKLKLKNTGKKVAKNIKIFALPCLLTPKENLKDIDEIEQNKAKEVTFNFSIPDITGETQIPFLITYEDEDFNLYSINYSVGVKIEDNRKEKFFIAIDEIEPETVKVGEKVNAKIKIANIGNKDVKNLVAKVTEKNGLFSKEEFIGELDQGDFDLVYVTFYPKTRENPVIEIKLQYTVDEKELSYSKEMEIPLVFEKEEEKGLTYTSIFTLILVLAILSIVLFRSRKIRK